MKTPRLLALGIVSLFFAASAALAVTETWDGGGGNDNLSTGLNWADNSAPASDLVNTDLIFAGVLRPTPNVSVAGFAVHSITFNATATAFTIGGSVLNIGAGGITNDDTQMQEFTNVLVFGGVANSVIDAAAGPLRFTNGIGLPTGTLTVTGNTEFQNFIGTQAILKQGTGTMIWTPTASQDCDVTVSAGTLRFGADGSTDVLSANASLAINGSSVLDLDESLTLAGALLTRASGATVTLAAGKTLRIQNSGAATFTGAFTGSAAQVIDVSGAGSTLTILGGGALGIRGEAALDVNAGGAVASTGPLNVATSAASGGGGVVVRDLGSSLSVDGQTLLATNGNMGYITIVSGGTGTFAGLNVGVSSSAGTDGQLSIQSGAAVTATGLAIGSGTGVNTGAANLSGAGSSLTVLGPGATTIGAAANAVGSLTLASGTTFSSGTGPTTVNATGTISIEGTYRSRGDLTLNGGALTRSSSGIFTLDPGTTLRVQSGGSAAFTGAYAASTPASIIVTGIDSTLTTTSTLNFNGASTAAVFAGGEVAAGGSLNIGTSGDGTATVSGAFSKLSAGGTLNVGLNGATGGLSFSNGSDGAFGAIRVDASTVTGTDGTLEILSGADVTGTSLAIASSATANSGLVRITGEGSTLWLTDTTATTIGAASASTGTLSIEAGGTFLSNAALTTVHPTGTITIAGGTCSAAGNLTLNGGQLTRDAAGAFLLGATRTLTVQAGGAATFTGAFTGSAAQIIDVSGAGSTLTILGGGALGIRGEAALDVNAGGAVASTGPLNVATSAASGGGGVVVRDLGSSLSVDGQTLLATNGNTGYITIVNRGTGTFAGLNVGVSSTAGTDGQLSIQSGATVTATGLAIGSGTGVNTGAANLTGAGSSLSILGAGATTIGAAANAVGSLTLASGTTFSSGTGPTTVNATGTISITSGTYRSRGNLTVNGGVFSHNSSFFALDPGTTFTVQNGGRASIGTFLSTTAADIVGGTLESALLVVEGGSTMSVRAGGRVTAFDFGLIGVGDLGRDGTVTVDGGSRLTGGYLTVGFTLGSTGAGDSTGHVTLSDSSTGAFDDIFLGGLQSTLEVQSGAELTCGRLNVASASGFVSTGVVTITGGASRLRVGERGATIGASSNSSGTLNVQNGGSFSAGSTFVNQTGTVAITGESLFFGDALTIHGGLLTCDAASLIAVTEAVSVQGGGTAIITADLTFRFGSVVVTGVGSSLSTSADFNLGGLGFARCTVGSGGTFTTGTLVTLNDANDALNVEVGGKLTGAADYAGAGRITIAGFFVPGMATGPNRTTSVSFAQALLIEPSGIITMELGGTVPGTSHDQLDFNGPGTPHVTWNGTLVVVPINGFVPQVGHSFNLFDFDPERDAGAFTSINLPTLGTGRFWRTDGLYVDGTIAVSSTPGTYAQWQAAYGTGAFDADDDGDGIKNGIEFLLGTDPTVAFAPGLHPIVEFPRLGVLARVTFDIPQFPANDAIYEMQSSPNLVTWTTIATKIGAGPWAMSAGVTVASDPPVAGFVNTIVSEQLPAGTARRYHRLVGTQP